MTCLCGEGKLHVEIWDSEHGWRFHSGQCCDCLNIRVFHNGALPEHADTDPAFFTANSDEIHICDLEAFIEALERVRSARSGR